MNVLIVHAHPEPGSFVSSLKNRAVDRLRAEGHSVEISDLYALGFDPVADRRNFTTVANPDFYQQRVEELHATENDGFAPDVAAEMEKLLRADLLVFSFPLWWFGMPAILKGWVDRVMAMGKMYGLGRLYEQGVGRDKHALLLMATGGPENLYNARGMNPELASIVTPIEHGIFWFLGFAPLPRIVVHNADRMSDEARGEALTMVEEYISGLDQKLPRRMARTDQFDGGFVGTDRYTRWMVQAAVDPAAQAADVDQAIEQLTTAGSLLSVSSTREGSSPRRLWATVRASDWPAAEAALSPLLRHATVDSRDELH